MQLSRGNRYSRVFVLVAVKLEPTVVGRSDGSPEPAIRHIYRDSFPTQLGPTSIQVTESNEKRIQYKYITLIPTLRCRCSISW
jgi:hypothetical protein